MPRTIPPRQTPRRALMAGVIVAALAALSGCAAGSAAPAPSPSASGSASGSGSGPAAPTVERDIVYREVDGRQLHVDACLPAGEGPHPTVVAAHGGAFREGSRADMGIICESLAEEGFAAFAVEYRLVPDTFPAPVDDVVAAVEWLRQPAQADRFALDGSTSLLGTSAGAIISLSTAIRLDIQGAPVQSVVGFSAAGDLRPQSADFGEHHDALRQVVQDYLGCPDLAVCEAAVAASPLAEAERLPPTFLVHGSDELIPLSQAEDLDAALSAAGVPHELIVVPTTSHGADLIAGDIPERAAAFLAEVHGVG